jgi:hypothetical protein
LLLREFQIKKYPKISCGGRRLACRLIRAGEDAPKFAGKNISPATSLHPTIRDNLFLGNP